MILSNVYSLVVQLPLFFLLFVLIRTSTNPAYCSTQIVRSNEILLYFVPSSNFSAVVPFKK
jgi:hypothetical protein